MKNTKKNDGEKLSLSLAQVTENDSDNISKRLSAASDSFDEPKSTSAVQGSKGFVSSWSPYVKSTTEKIINRQPYSFDINSDKAFAQYKNMYEQQGRRAMEDTVGNAALLTGGYGNSYGVTAGQQAYNGYMDKLADKGAELENEAYNRWINEGQTLLSQLQMLQTAENSDYNRYRDSVDDYYNNRDFRYKQQQDALKQSNYEREQAQKKYESDRNYQFNMYKLGSSLQEGVNDSKNDNEIFNPSDAYDFLKKYGEKIRSDDELVESLYQLYGEQEGFYSWLGTVKIFGDKDGKTYITKLLQLHPEITGGSYNAKKEMDKEVYRHATNGGATPPHSLTYNITG